MKNIKFIALFLASALIWSCEDEIISYALQDISAPTNVSAIFDITQDDTGLVTITPSGEGVNSFLVFFGDTDNTSEPVSPGGTAQFAYPEGQYDVRVVGEGATGLTSEFARTIMISFRAPENLEAGIVIDNVNPSMVTVTPSAEFATMFDVYFGDVANEVPTSVLAGESISKLYGMAGAYTIRVVAKGAGVTTTEVSEAVTISAASDPVTLPIDFESFTVNYAFVSFGPDGDHATVVDNPNKSGINTADKVAQFNKVDGSEVWAGTFLTLDAPIDFDNNDLITVKVHSPKAGATVKLKVENLTDPAIGAEMDQVTTVADAWEELTFDFSMIDKAQTYQKVVIFFDFGNAGDNSTYYYDDVVLKSSSTCIAETAENIDPAMGDINWTFMTNDAAHAFEPFGNIGSEIVANPVQDMVNSSCAVQRYAKTAGCETWSGVGKALATSIDLTTSPNKLFGMKVFAQDHTTQVTLRLEFEPFPNAEPSADVVADISAVGVWEQLYFDFSAHSDKTFKSVIVYFDRNNACDDAVYYFDDIEQLAGIPIDCDSEMTSNVDPAMGTIDWSFQDGMNGFDAFGNISAPVVMNPVTNGINTSCNVQRYEKTSGCETWSGVGVALDNAIDLTSSTATSFSMMVMAETHTTDVTLRLEFEPHPNTDPAADIVQTISSVGVWEELTFDFSAHTDKTFKSMIVYFDRNQPCDGAVYYFDNIVQFDPASCAAESTANMDPASGDINWTFQDGMNGFDAFGNITAPVVSNPVVSGINNSCNVQKYEKTSGCETWSGVGVGLDNIIDMGTAANKKFSLKVLAETHVTDVTLRLEFEPHPNTDPAVDVVQSITATGEWQELIFDFSAHTDKTFKSIIIYFDRNQPCDDAIYYFDDLKQIN